jgi:hypothetical protein
MKINNKRKFIVGGVISLTSVALISTGFASWAIASLKEETTEANVTFAAITSGELTLNVVAPTESFEFGPRKDDNTGRVKYGTTTDTTFEDLTIAVTGDVSDSKSCSSLSFAVSAIPNESASPTVTQEEVNTIIGKGYINLPDTTSINNVYEVTSDSTFPTSNGITAITTIENSGDTKASFSENITLSWGSYFNSENPSDYFDDTSEGGGRNVELGTSADESSVTSVFGMMKKLKEDLAKIKFKITVTATPR